jgi:hypothetical protein
MIVGPWVTIIVGMALRGSRSGWGAAGVSWGAAYAYAAHIVSNADHSCFRKKSVPTCWHVCGGVGGADGRNRFWGPGSGSGSGSGSGHPPIACHVHLHVHLCVYLHFLHVHLHVHVMYICVHLRMCSCMHVMCIWSPTDMYSSQPCTGQLSEGACLAFLLA